MTVNEKEMELDWAERRFKGEFFTPTEWVDESHKMITEEFGEDWKDKYVVWDPACGTGNLTRDYKFKELYCSTINQSDIDIMNQMKYNPEAVKFQFDFLNDSYDKLPAGLKKALEEGKQIIVLMNPPYGTSSNLVKGTSKKHIAKTLINNQMNIEKLDRSASQLYAQFIFRLHKLSKETGTQIHIAMYAPQTYMTGQVFKEFRRKILYSYGFKKGMLFKASNFADVSSEWAISFVIWKYKSKISDILLDIKQFSEEGKVNIVKVKQVYNTDLTLPLNRWLKDDVKGVKTFDAPQLSSAVTVKPDGYGRLAENALGYSVSSKNIPESNSTMISIFTSTFSGKNGFSILESNIMKVIVGFTVRKSVSSNWINQKDEYLAPNTEHPDYEQWNNDCLVYSLFNNSSNQSSLRDITYKDKQWDIINEWFWMSNETIKNWAEDHIVNEIELDCKNFPGERFIYKKLQETPLSEDAKNILEQAESLVINSFEFRKIMIEEYPEYHLNTWDAGFYQIKLILKKYMPDELKAFRRLYKEFEDRMREGVYKFGFLKE